MNGCVYVWMGGWVHAWMDGWVDRWMDGWMNEWMNELMNEWMNEWRSLLSTNDWAIKNKQMNDWVNNQTNEWRNVCIAMYRHMRDSTVGCCMVTTTPSSSSTLSVSCYKTLTPACPTSSQVWVSKYPKLQNCISHSHAGRCGWTAQAVRHVIACQVKFHILLCCCTLAYNTQHRCM